MSGEQAVDGMPWIELTPAELWDRLLYKTWLGKRLCPKAAFLRALDTPKYRHRFTTNSTGPR